MSQGIENAIAVIGMAGRFPGAASVGEFWNVLRQGLDVCTEFTDEELSGHVSRSLLENSRFVKRGYVLEGAENFDPECFGYSPAEAAGIDPQQRLLLMTARDAMEDAGYAPGTLSGDVSVGVWTSVSPSGGLKDQKSFSSDPAGYMGALLANDKDYASSRISYKLNLKGPSMTVQTACSSSLVGVSLACQSLLDYGCDMALAGGATVIFPQKAGYLSLEEGGLSADGRCHAFDHRASGMNFGSGVAMVLLKRLEDAEADGDHVYGIIRGFAVNNDGSDKVGFTAPSVSGQRAVIEEALAQADVPASSITYVETHGTGTPMGDPIEVKALSLAYGKEGGPCELGSVKSNVGHLNAAAGAAGLVKAMLCLEHAEIPPLMNFEAPNPALELEKTRFTVGAPLHSWTASPRRAGVSSFGLGGTNCHLILEEAPKKDSASPEKQAARILPFSARSDESVKKECRQFADWALAHPEASFRDAAFTLQNGREAQPFRRAVVASSLAGAAKELQEERWIGQPGGIPKEGARACFMFPGAGSQHVGMGQGLYRDNAVFREAVDECAETVRKLAGFDVREMLYPSEDRKAWAEEAINMPLGGFCSLFAVEWAMARVWMSLGVRPAAVGGHSFGQYPAAAVAGIMSPEDALKVAVKRGQLMDKVKSGGMVLAFASEEQIRPFLKGSLSLAVINTDRLCTVAGEDGDLEALEAALKEKRMHFRRVQASRPGHSCFMDPILDEFGAFMKTIPLHEPAIPMLSNVTGTWMTPGQAQDPENWTKHIRSTVRFFDDMSALFEDSGLAAMEVGPGRVLSAMLRRHPKAKGRAVISSMHDAGLEEDDSLVLLKAEAAAFCAGVGMDFEMEEGAGRISLPAVPFDEKPFPVTPKGSTPEATGGRALLKSLMNKQEGIENWFFMPLWNRTARLSDSLPQKGIPRTWAVFEDGYGISAPLCDRLAEAGCTVVRVRMGSRYLNEANVYTIDPLNEGHYAQLFQELKNMGISLDRIVHAWTLSPQERTTRSPENLQHFTQIGYSSLICVARGLTAAGMDQDMGVAVLTNEVQSVTGDEALIPEKALVLGPCRVMPSEYRGIQTLSIDLDPEGTPMSPETVCSVIRDVSAIPAGEASTEGWVPVRAYRRGFAWEQSFQHVHHSLTGPVPLKEGGCYVITGGFGGVAGVLSGFLADKYKARIVLTSRRAVPAREQWEEWTVGHGKDDFGVQAIGRIRDLENRGAQVLAVQADVASADDMDRAWKAVRERFGHVDGIFHAASVAASSMIQVQTPQRSAQVLGPKVYGALNIEKFADEEKPDFVFLFSSISSHVGALGHTDYTAACLFLDCLAHTLNGRAPYRVLAVNWGYWQGVGIGVKLLPKLIDLLGNDVDVRGILPMEGMQCIERALAAPVDQMIVSTSDYQALIHVFLRSTKDALRNYETYNASSSRSSRPNLASAYRKPSTAAEEIICGVWQELLGFDGLGVDDNFFDLGGDSLHALPMVGKLEEIFRIKVPVRVVITENTVAKLAAWLVSQDKTPGRTERIAKVYLKIKSMTPEEIRKMAAARGK